MKKQLFIGLLCSLGIGAFAQNINDVVNINSPIRLGTPRYVALGGAFTALGNDFTGVHLNPAGLGVFRADEFGFTMGGGFNGANSSFYGTNTQSSYNNFLLPSIGFVTKLTPKDPDATWNLGITFNRNNSLNLETNVSATSPNSSIVQEWARNANGIDGPDLAAFGYGTEELAWGTYLIDNLPDLTYTSQVVATNVQKFVNEINKGRFDELGISLAREKDNKLYLGGSFNLAFYKQTNDFEYAEGFPLGDSIRALEYIDNYSNRGIGFNLKFGAIYKPTKNVRLGASLFSPTWLWMRQEYVTQVTAIFVRSKNLTGEMIGEQYKYRLRSAPQANLGFAYVFDKNGLISLDYTFMATKWSGSGTNDLSYLNEDINNFLNNQHSLRAGAEIRAINWFFRLGYSWLSDPYNFELQNGSTRGPSFGLGHRTRNFTFDIAYALQRSNYNFYLYSADLTPPIVQDITRQSFVVSMGFRL